jgi:integrase
LDKSGIAHTMINRAFDNDMVDGRTVKAFRRTKKLLKRGSNARDRVLTFEEYRKLLDASPDHLKDVVITAFNTGMRKGELLSLQWKHVDLKTGFIRLTADDTKEGKPKKIPINHHVKAVLGALPCPINRDLHVFTYLGEPVKECKRAFQSACKTASIPYGRDVPNGIDFHDIRATVKTNMLEAGVDKAYRDMILGHALQGMDAHYLRTVESRLTDAMERYTAWIDAQFESVAHTVAQEAKKG